MQFDASAATAAARTVQPTECPDEHAADDEANVTCAGRTDEATARDTWLVLGELLESSSARHESGRESERHVERSSTDDSPERSAGAAAIDATNTSAKHLPVEQQQLKRPGRAAAALSHRTVLVVSSTGPTSVVQRLDAESSVADAIPAGLSQKSVLGHILGADLGRFAESHNRFNGPAEYAKLDGEADAPTGLGSPASQDSTADHNAIGEKYSGTKTRSSNGDSANITPANLVG